MKVERTAKKQRVERVAPIERASKIEVVETHEAPLPSGASAKQRLVSKNPDAKSLAELRAAAKEMPLDQVFETHLADFQLVLSELRDQPASIVFFGGARLKEGDPYYALARAFGAALAEVNIPPKTGAGPGAMHAIPDEYVQVRGPLVDENSRTLGFNIHLPKEQHVSASIEEAHEVQLFAFRKLALYENVRGVVVFPGGFGTLDELFEVLVLKREGRTTDPIVLAGREYWAPILDALRAQARRGKDDLLSGLLEGVLVTDDPKEALQFVVDAKSKAFETEPDKLDERMVRELRLARYVATSLPSAVTFLGGAKLRARDPAMVVGKQIAEWLAGRTPVRTAERHGVGDVVTKAGGTLQRVTWSPRGSTERAPGTAQFTERIPHKEVLLRNSDAYVALPDAGRGLDELGSLLCQIQTGKLPKKPVVLVDKAFWTPIIEAWKHAMLGQGRAYIEPDDLKLFTMVDTLEEAQAALAGV